MNPRILCVLGTRPEAIKMAPVIQALRKRSMDVITVVTAQHRGLLDQMLGVFDLRPDRDLDAMEPGQTLASLTGKLVPGLANIIDEIHPDALLAQGDTTTVFCSALAAFYLGVPFGHVEAGLRSQDLRAPFPEEGMRRLTATLTKWHFAPTQTARAALLAEGIRNDAIHVVGNTVIDALFSMANRDDLSWPPIPPLAPGERLVLVTLHRRENFGKPMEAIFEALRTFSRRHPEARILYPVHPNPQVKGPAESALGGLPNVHLVEPLDYPTMVGALKQSFLVLTDSGGLQEEGPALGKPVLVFRDVTERPEAVDAGGAQLVGGSGAAFLDVAEALWNQEDLYGKMAIPRFPFGNGQAASRIADILAADLAGVAEGSQAGSGA